MASAEELRDLEALTPWSRPDFVSGLASLTASGEQAARQYAIDARVLASLVALVPRCSHDDRGATPWTSFRREVAVARRVSDRAAAALIRTAVALTSTLLRTMDLLESGGTTVERASAFARELEPYDDDLARAVDAVLASRAADLPPWRIAQEVRRAVQKLDPEAGAQRVATKNAARGVSLQAEPDDQASVTIFGPAVPLTRWHDTLDEQARALKQAGDERGLDALRFDLATSTFPCSVHVPVDATRVASPGGGTGAPADGDPARPGPFSDADADADAGLRPAFVEAAVSDCRRGRPVQASIVVPVETALGLSQEPAWLDGYGWVSAPTSRLLLVDAELRQLCAQSGTGQQVDLADRAVRPPPTPSGVRGALLDMVLDTPTLTGIADRVEPQHDPSEPLRRFTVVRDRACDGPTGSRVSSRRSQLDHDVAHPEGPTAAWNLVARGARTHQLKHYGWTPLRTPTGTIWTSPAGQLVLVPNHTWAPPGVDADPHDRPVLPDPEELDLLDRGQLEAPGDSRPWLPAGERDATEWTWLAGDDLAGEDQPGESYSGFGATGRDGVPAGDDAGEGDIAC